MLLDAANAKLLKFIVNILFGVELLLPNELQSENHGRDVHLVNFLLPELRYEVIKFRVAVLQSLALERCLELILNFIFNLSSVLCIYSI